MECTKETYIEMVQAALVLCREQPWNLFDAYEVFQIELSSNEIPTYCLFREVEGHKCLTIFDGAESFTDLSNHFKPTGIPRLDAYHAMYACVIEITFDDEGSLSEEELAIAEELGLTAREMPIFRERCNGTFRGIPHQVIANRLLRVLNALYDALQVYMKEGLDLDFHKQRFSYRASTKKHTSKRVSYRPKKYDLIEVDDPELIKALKKCEKTDEIWEVDVQLSPVCVLDEHQYEQVLSMAVMASLTDQMVMASVPMERRVDQQFFMIDLMVEALFQRGLPKQVLVRHPLVYSAIFDLTKRLKIKLKQTEEFDIVDEFIDGFSEFYERKEKSC